MRTLIDQSAHPWTSVSRCALLPLILAFLPLITPRSFALGPFTAGGAGISSHVYAQQKGLAGVSL